MTNDQPDRDGLVSIITPAYGAQDTIDAMIESVIAQSYSNWELLITEDCGPDSTKDRIRVWETRDPRIRLIEAASNGGPAAARNLSLAAAKGRWIAFLDSDDLWLPHKLERQLSHHRNHPEAVISFTGFRRIDATAEKTGRYVGVPHRLQYAGLLGNTAIATSTVIVDTRLAGNIQMRQTYYDDFACWLSLLKGGGVAVGLNEDLMRYRVQSGSVSRNKFKSAAEVWKALRTIEGLGFLSAAFHFARYATNAVFKYRGF